MAKMLRNSKQKKAITLQHILAELAAIKQMLKASDNQRAQAIQIQRTLLDEGYRLEFTKDGSIIMLPKPIKGKGEPK